MSMTKYRWACASIGFTILAFALWFGGAASHDFGGDYTTTALIFAGSIASICASILCLVASDPNA